jgi:GMP synthase (glutamine-hydrolysing)
MLDANLQDNGQERAAGQIPVAYAARETEKAVCIVLHQENSNPGHVGQWFVRNGYRLDIRKPRFGDPLPATLEHHCGAVIFGGPMSANDKDEFIAREIEWIGVALEEKKPLLGICLGAQMLAVHLGARVGFHPEEMVEIGYYPLAPTEHGLALGPWPEHVYQWHREGCELPSSARLLATSSRGAFPNQAFAYGPTAFGVQFHPEITFAQVHRWTGHSAQRLEMKGARQRHEHIDGHINHGPRVRAWLDRFLGRWAKAELGPA